MHRVKNIIINAIRDGYVAVSIAAPLLSIALTTIKFLDLDWAMRDAFRELSYAWALLPITIWFAIAYVRRHAAWEDEQNARIAAESEPLSDEKQSNVNSKLIALSLEAKRALYRIITAEIEVDRLEVGMRSELEEAEFVKRAFAYTPAKLNEPLRPFIERWFRWNPL